MLYIVIMEIIKKVIKVGNSNAIILDTIIMDSLVLKNGDLIDISSIYKVEPLEIESLEVK